MVTSTTDANGGVITYRYSSQGNVCEIIDQDGNSETFRYDREGRRILHVDRNGNEVRTRYNVDGNPVYESGCDKTGERQETRSWAYDSFGQKTKAVAGGFCYTYEYRPDGKLLKKSSSGRNLLTFTYEKDGILKTLTDVSGKTLFYGYDWRGNLESIKDQDGNRIVKYSHYADGKLKTIHHLNGVKTFYEYDTDGNISRLATFVSEGKALFDFRYEYDLNGTRVAKMGSRMDGLECGERFVNGDLKDGEADSIKEEMRLDFKETETTVLYKYDSRNRLLTESYDEDVISYQYDPCGNRKEKQTVAGKETYCYNRRNQLMERSSQGESWVYQYDKQGNVLEETGSGERREYGYNPFGQQTEVKKSGFEFENLYDGEGFRAGTKANETISYYIYDQGELQAETCADGSVRSRYILGYGVAGSEVEGRDGYHAYHLDERKSTAYITGNQREVENFYEYDAFGSLKSHSEEIRNRILYTGQQYDQETGQYYLRARFYNPVVGRFLQEDVYRGDGLNLYAYCENNPVMYYDPSGYKKIWPCKDEGATQTGSGRNEGAGVRENIPPKTSGKYQVGAYQDIKSVEGMDAHHVGQKAIMKKLVADYDYKTAPAINVPKVGHTISGPKGIVSRSTKGITNARQLLARDLFELRRVYPDIPNSTLKELIDLNKNMYPEMRK